jgi:predicted nucleotidyltransferase
MQRILTDNINEIRKLCQTYSVKTMYAFGSVCNDKFDEDSDVDLLISFKDISIKEYTDNDFDLHYKLEEIYKQKIDLLTENSLSNPYFIRQIEQTKQLIYAA